MRNLPFLPVLLLGALLPAQTAYVVSPLAYTSAEGPGRNHYPWWDRQFTYQQIHDDLGSKPGLVVEVAFRRDGVVPNSMGNPAFAAGVTLRLSTAALPSAAASGTFAANHGPDLVEVLTQTTVQFPATTQPSPPPAPFAYVLAFPTRPFLYKGTGSLCWEVRVHSTTSTQPNHIDFAETVSSYTNFGAGCRAAGSAKDPTTYGVCGPNAAPPGTYRFYIQASNLTASQPFLALVGASNRQWGSLPLPLDLGPLGGTGCNLLVAPLIAQGGITDGAGAASTAAAPLILPGDPLLAGLSLYHQALAVDPGKPAFPLVFSDGCATVIPRLEPLSRIYYSGSDTALSGGVGLCWGLVTQFGLR